MSISMYSDSSSVSTLFSGLKSSSTGLEGVLSNYSMLKNGSVGRLAKAYYGTQNGTNTTTNSSANKSTSSDYNYKSLNDYKTSKGEYTYFDHKTQSYIKSDASGKVKSDTSTTDASKTDSKTSDASGDSKTVITAAQNMMDSAAALTATGTSSVFAKKTIADEDGNESYGYDTKAIKNAVSKFVDNYNVLLNDAAKSENSSISSYANALKSLTNSEKTMLDKLGISIDSEKGTLSIDDEKFNSADMNTAKTLFNGSGSYAYQVSSRASMINYYATSESASGSTAGTTYNANAAKTSNAYSVGDLYSQYT